MKLIYSREMMQTETPPSSDGRGGELKISHGNVFHLLSSDWGLPCVAPLLLTYSVSG